MSSSPTLTASKINFTAEQARATAGFLEWATEVDDGQDWAIGHATVEVLRLEDAPNDDQFRGAAAIIEVVAARLADLTCGLTAFTVDEQLLLAALLDYAFHRNAVGYCPQSSIQRAAEALYPQVGEAPSASQCDHAYQLLREVRDHLAPLPERPQIQVGDALLADDLEELQENEYGYRIVAVSDTAVVVVDADGVDHAIERAAIDGGDATVVGYFGDFKIR